MDKKRSSTGQYTAAFGYWLTAHFAQHQLRVICGHGKPAEEIHVFVGEQYANHNILADVDLLIASASNEVLWLIEIEESALHPKKLLGDLFAVLMADTVATRKQVFYLSDRSRLIIAGWLQEQGNGFAKIEQTILPRLTEFSGFQRGILPANVEMIFTGSIDATVNQLQARLITWWEEIEKLSHE